MAPRGSRGHPAGLVAGAFISTVLLVVANLLIPAAILTFATGFFPYKPLLPGLAEFQPVAGYDKTPEPPFDRLVFMVIDALRSDFVYSPNSGFEYVQSLIRDGVAIPFTAHATSPTVTMPRLKAITTGSIPSFLDVVLNLDEGDESSTLASQDTWLAQMKAKGTGKLVMYGDDTWLKLFPGTFDRADGTTSFFVSDFTEVDNNVTRHIADELRRDDWNTMVLHYLGLDHIGHKGGPRSTHMIPKQREMDGIVKEIFSAIESEPHLQSTLFVVCGDHGMNDAGNHGASSPGETSPALVFLSPKLKALQSTAQAPVSEAEDFQYYSTVEQSDLAPTLAALLGFPVPKNNLGALIPEFLPFWLNNQDQAQLLLRNAYQILDIITAASGADIFEKESSKENCVDPNDDYKELACEWKMIAESKDSEDGTDAQWVSSIVRWLRKAQGLMSGMASNYNVTRLLLGQAIIVIAAVLALGSVPFRVTDDSRVGVWSLTAVTITYGVMMFASSYVEEEQHFWYWATTAWFFVLGLKGFNSATSKTKHVFALFLMLATVRLARAWNQTGQKFAGEPDVVKIFLYPNPLLLWILVAVTYVWIHRELINGFNAIPAPISYSAVSGLVLAAVSFKVAFTHGDAPELVVGFAKSIAELEFTQGHSLVSQARAVFFALGFGVACALFYLLTNRPLSITSLSIETIHHLYTLLALTQSRTTNIPLFLLFHIQYLLLRSSLSKLTFLELATSSLLLQYTSFFALGGSNAISSVDLSSAYNGIADFNVLSVGILTFISNWAGPIYWVSATSVLLIHKVTTDKSIPPYRIPVYFRGHVALLTVFATCSVGAVMASCTVLRTHLFIWTVFSPKYLYCVAWGVGQHLLVNIGWGGVMFWLGVRERMS
ncbi:GPI ethanolamine phosphate transferase 2 [Echria macrotheca]|uniref:GPI ethanolamine phosphate transferase 2 n=1 Tax=Echria macrotheca TaxID=438768 RepID=A0AAJ0B2X5_9PEZI|nr:GPI ethanolamine phosphate transferase 2 [Echria macrotheca]